MTGRLGTAKNTVSTVLANRALRRIEAAFLGFTLAEYGTWIALLVYAQDATGSESVGLIAVAQLIPAAVFAPIAAGFGDRFPRIRVLFGGYLLIALACIAVAAAMAVGASPAIIYGASIMATAAMTMPRPLQAAITPAYAETPEQLTATNGITTIVEGLGILIGPLGAGILMAFGPPWLVFLAGGIVAGGSALLIIALGIRRSESRVATQVELEAVDRVPSALEPRSRSMLDGVRLIARDGGQILVTIILASRFAVAGALDVLLVLMATEALGIAGSGAGFLGAALGFGGVLGGALTLVLVGRRGLPSWIVAGAVGTGVGLALLTVAPAVPISMLLLAGSGIGLACIDVAGRTLLQRFASREVLAEVFGLVEGFAMLGLAIGSVGAAILYTSVGLAGALAATAAVMPVLALSTWVRLRRAEGVLELPVAQIALLRSLPLFAAVAAPSLEAAARRLGRFVVPAGATVIREGDPGERFYVLASGSVDISRQGSSMATLGRGESFGEIALLRNVPRTATVTALTDVELWALDRDDFLLAITGSPQAVADAHARADAMLAADQAPA